MAVRITVPEIVRMHVQNTISITVSVTFKMTVASELERGTQKSCTPPNRWEFLKTFDFASGVNCPMLDTGRG